MARSTRQVRDGVSFLHLDMDMVFSRIPLVMMWIIIYCGDTVLFQYLGGGFTVFHLVIFRSDMGLYNILNDKVFHLLSPLTICCSAIVIPKEELLNI